MKISNIILIASLTCFYATPTLANDLVCEAPKGLSTALTNINMSLSSDYAIGTVLYKGKVFELEDDDSSLYCINTTSQTITTSVRLVAGITGSVIGDIYNTGIPGVGIRFIHNGTAIKSGEFFKDISITLKGNEGDWITTKGETNKFDFELVKTGEITPAVYSISNFPEISLSMNIAEANYRNDHLSVNFAGSIAITAPTCDIQNKDLTIELGDHKIPDIKSSTVSSWKNANLVLTSCRGFTGHYVGAGSATYSGYSSGPWDSTRSEWEGVYPAQIANSIDVTITNVQPAHDINTGIMLPENASGAASGIGIQIAKGDTGNNSPVIFGQSWNLNPPSSSDSITIPLVARIIKINENMTPGTIKGKMTYVINYK